MTYFRNKFNEEFLFLANQQKPKGGRMQINEVNPFFKVVKNRSETQSTFISVIPLLLFNRIITNNENDLNIEDKMVLCREKYDTIVECCYDENYVNQWEDYICKFGINNITGDLE